MLSTEFWIVFQMLTILVLIGFLVYFLRNIPGGKGEAGPVSDDGSGKVKKMLGLMESLLNEAESTARIFESQIIEKKQLIYQLNEKLDSRIISLNLLLNRADACLSMNPSLGNTDNQYGTGISDMQEAILALFSQGKEAQAISDTLSVSRKEVDLVISLKKKFIAMEKDS